MAVVRTFVSTIEEPGDGNRNHGSWEVKLFAGLDEDPAAVFADAMERLQAALAAIPPEKRYSRLPGMGLTQD